MAEQADAKVSKTFEINSRVGSIPTIPIRIVVSGQWSVVRQEQAFQLTTDHWPLTTAYEKIRDQL